MAGNYTQVMHFGTKTFDAPTLNVAKKIATNNGMKVGQSFKLVRVCHEDHRRNPGKRLVSVYTKIQIDKVCKWCDRVTRSRTRIVEGASHTHFRIEVDGCDSPFCIDYQKWIQLKNLDWHDMQDKMNKLYLEFVSESLYRVSKYPEMNKYRYPGCGPGCLIDDTRPLNEYILEWYKKWYEKRIALCDSENASPEEESMFDKIMVKHYHKSQKEMDRQAKMEEHPDVQLERYLEANQLDGYDPEM